MSIDEKGISIKEGEAASSREYVPIPEGKLANYYDALSTQSLPPRGVTVPEGIFLWLGDRLEHNKEVIVKMQELSEETHLETLTNPHTQEEIDLTPFFIKMEQSVVFSEDINRRNENGQFAYERTEEELAAIRKRIMNN